MTASIILLSGPPGAGKTTVAAAMVANAPEAKVANIEGDKFWFFAAKGGGGPRELSPIVMPAMIGAALPYARAGFTTIVDFTIGPWFLPAVKPAAQDVALDFVILCPSLAECKRRAGGRTEGVIDYAPYVELHEAFAQFPGFDRHMISDDAPSAEETAARIWTGVRDGAFRVS
jgi:hypothetical protein